MFDPFPQERSEIPFSIPKETDEYVYRLDRYEEGNSPKMLFYPSRRLLFKMMRATIGVKKKEELWYKRYENPIKSF